MATSKSTERLLQSSNEVCGSSSNARMYIPIQHFDRGLDGRLLLFVIYCYCWKTEGQPVDAIFGTERVEQKACQHAKGKFLIGAASGQLPLIPVTPTILGI